MSRPHQSSQPTTKGDKLSDKPPSDDWSLHLTPSQTQTQSQAVFTTTTVLSSQTREREPKEVEQSQHEAETGARTVLSSQKQVQDRQSEREQSETPDMMRAPEGSPFDGNISSVPRHADSVDPSQSSSRYPFNSISNFFVFHLKSTFLICHVLYIYFFQILMCLY